MSKTLLSQKKEESKLDFSIEEVVVEETRDDQPDFVRVKYTDRESNEIVGHTRVMILVD